MDRDQRLALISEIEKARESRVIAYVTSDRPGLAGGLETYISEDVIPILHEHIESIPREERQKIDLFIYSRGGESDVPWSIVSMFREYLADGQLSVLIPYKAHSAATIIALGADEIVMGKKAELGPIDITIGRGPYNPVGLGGITLPISVEDVTGFFSLLERVGCEGTDEKMRAFESMTQQVHPLALGNVNRLLQQTELVANRMLRTRNSPLSDEQNKDIVRRLSSEIFSHRHAISRTEALNDLKLEQVVKSEDCGIMDPLWNLYTGYRDYLKLQEPFKAEQYLFDNDLEQHTWTDLDLACVESRDRLDIRRGKLQLRRLRQVPPNLQVNVTLPPITLPPLPAGMDPNGAMNILLQELNGTLQPAIDQAVKGAVDQLVKSLPPANYAWIPDVDWVHEA